MPGDEVGDRVHNFFDQENLSQSQHHSQAIDGNWPVLSNNQWAVNQGLVGASFLSGIKHSNVQSSESSRGIGNTNMRVSHGRPEFAIHQSHNLHSNLNGYMQDHHLLQARQNEEYSISANRVPDQHNLASSSFYSLNTPQNNGPGAKKGSVTLEADESPINFDFLGGQPKMSLQQHDGMLQTSPWQQSEFNDNQQLQQQAVMRQMQQLQRQQQIHHQGFRHQNSTSYESFSKQDSPIMINGTPVHDGSNYAYTHARMSDNSTQRGVSPMIQESYDNVPMRGNSQGVVDQSLYGFPISNTRGTSNQYSHDNNIDMSTMLHLSTPNNSFTGHHNSVSKHGFDSENLFETSHGYVLDSTIGTNYSHVNDPPRINPVQEFSLRKEIADRSGKLPESTTIGVASSQNSVALDPTEKKILFGTDENLWDAFGKTDNVSPEGYNVSDGIVSHRRSPSLQNGSWSALMLSALAETSGSDTGQHDEWSGLTFPNSQLTPGSHHHPSIFNDVNNVNNNSTFPGFQHSEINNSLKGDMFLSMSSHRPSIGQSLEESDKWKKNHSPLHDIRSSNAESRVNTSSGLWSQTHQEITSTHNTDNSRPFNNPNGRNLMGTGNSLQRSQVNESERDVHEGMDWTAGPRKISTVIESINELGHGKPDIGTTLVNRGDLNLNNDVTTMQSLSTGKGDQDTNQHYLYNHQLKNNNIQILESNNTEKGVVKMHHMDNIYNKKGNSNARSHSKLPNHDSLGGGVRENVWLDANESRSLPGGKHKSSSGQIGLKSSSELRKFQFHPMGNLEEDVEPYLGTKLSTMAPPVTSQLGTRGLNSLNQGPSAQSKFAGHFRRNFNEIEKSRSHDSQVDNKNVDEVPSKSNFLGAGSNTSPFDRHRGTDAPMKTTKSSHNIAELLPKIDQSREHGDTTHPSSSNRSSPSVIPEGETSDRFENHLHHNHSSASQGFGLQLAPPSQRLPVVPNRAFSSYFSPHTGHSLNPNVRPCETGDKGRMLVGPTFNLPSKEKSQSGSHKKSDFQTEIKNEAFSAHEFAFSRNQAKFGSSVQHITDNHKDEPCDRAALTRPSVQVSTHEAGTNQSKVPVQPISALDSEAVAKPGISKKGPFSTGLPNAWTNVVAKQKLLHAQPHQASSNLLNSQIQSSNIVETPNNQNAQRGDVSIKSCPSSMGAQGSVHVPPTSERPWQKGSASDKIDLVQKVTGGVLERNELVVNHQSDSSIQNAASNAQKNVNEFGRSLNTDSKLSQNYSLLQQMKTMRSNENILEGRDLKRFKGSDYCQNGLQASYGPKPNTVGDLSKNHDRSHVGNVPSQNMPVHGKNISSIELSGSDAVAVKNPEQIDPRMAPSWFKQFGTFKNGKIFPINDAQKNTALNSVEKPNDSITGKSGDGLQALTQTEKVDRAVDNNSQVINVGQSSTLTEKVSDPLPHPQPVLPRTVSDQSLVVPRPKKRKTATSELIPWHKEVSQGSKRLLTISMADVGWAKATNRLIDKVENDVETLMLRRKRRLILTTQLMQQLIHPPPVSVLTADCRLNYDSIAYSVAKSSLGDACSQLSCSTSDPLTPIESRNTLSKNLETKNGEQEQRHSEATVENFIGRAKKLESDLLRLDKKTSILDLRLECQDLEKISVIYRFAKFHGRGQADVAESSPSTDATYNPQRSFLQRHVIAHPLPKNLPDKLQCLSL